MMLTRKVLVATLALLLVTGAWGAAHAQQTITLPPPTPITVGGDGNFFAYSLTILDSFGLLPGGIPGSSPGQISSDLVLYTGTSNAGVNNNNIPAICGSSTNNCVDGAFQAPTGDGQNDPTASTFDTSAAPVTGALVTGSPADPAPNPWGAGDRPGTWDISINSLKGYLGAGNSPIFLLQQNQANSSGCGIAPAGLNSCQDIYGWGAVYLWNSANANNPGCGAVDGASGVPNGLAAGNCGAFKVFEFKGPTDSGVNFAAHIFDPNDGICTAVVGNNGQPATDLCNPTTAGTTAGVNTLDHTVNGYTDMGEFAFGQGAECLDATGANVDCNSPTKAFGPFNNNLGANLFAFAIESPGLNACLADPACSGGFDTFSVDFKLRGLTNGFEQLVIVPGTAPFRVAEPSAILVLGAGLLAASLIVWRLRRSA